MTKLNCFKNSNVKQGTSFKLHVEFSGLGFDLDEVSKIEFIFKRSKAKGSSAVKTNIFPYDCERLQDKNVVLVPFTKNETYSFPEGQVFYMDTRIYLNDSDDNLPTNIVELVMSDTLFDE